MRARARAVAALGAALVSLGAFGTGAGPAAADACPWMNTKLTPDTRAGMLLRAMSLSQKIAMTWQSQPDGAHYGTAGWIPAIPSLCIPDLTMNDAGQGVSDAQTGTTAFPAPIAQASAWDPSLQYAFGQALGQEAWDKGIDVQLTPGIETDRVLTNGRNWEYMSEDPYFSGQAASAVTRGIQSQHVIVTLKHYIANSQETNRMSDSADVSLRTLEEIYAPQYDVGIHQGGAMGLMCSYNRINSVYACESQLTLNRILDHQFGYQGFVVSDWGGTHSTVASAKAGLDIEMNVTPGTYFGSALQSAVQSGKVPMAVLNDMVLRIVRSMFAVGVFDHPPAAEPAAYSANVSTPDHVALARKISEEGTVLLKNQDGILPLTGSGRTIAVIGPDAGQAGAENNYNGGGSGHVPLAGVVPVVSPQTGITQRGMANGDTVIYADGSSTADAIAAAKAASVAVVFAGDSESEGTDRQGLTLTSGSCILVGCAPSTVDQNALISAVSGANPNTVVVLHTGGPVLTPWLSSVKGVMEAWFPGQENGNAIAALLFGDVDPGAHLTETWPTSGTAQPVHTTAQWPGVTVKGDTVGPHSAYSEGLDVGYRWYDAHGVKPLFPFGFGLSYTSFAFSRLRIVRARRGAGAAVSFTLTNTGSRDGADVAQVYVGMPPAAGEPPRQLKGFQKVRLSPGRSSRVTINLGPTAFVHWNGRTNAWAVSAGRYRIFVGDSSAPANLPLRGGVTLKASRVPAIAW